MLEIEIVELNIIEGGIEVFARAWKDGQQYGFGVDGSVDIERFIIKNPPVLVQDDAGDIVITQTYRKELDIPPTVTTYREDPEEALLQVLEENIRVMKNVHLGTRIESGKRGNTTTTIYANPDAYALALTQPNWVTARGLAAANAFSASPITEAPLIGERISASNFNLARNPYMFDTSGIPDTDTITSAVFSVRSTSSLGNGSETTNPANGALVGVTPADPTSLVAADYAQFGTTRYADTDVLRSAFANGVDSYKDWILNSTGLAAIDKTGYTKLGLRMSNDFSDSTAPVARSFALGYFSGATGTTNDPKLVIEHSAGGGAARRVFVVS